VERGVQGVDVDAANDTGERYTTEVKTIRKSWVAFQAKDARGLLARANDGYVPLLAVLRLSPLSQWYLLHARDLSPGRLQIDALRPYRCRDLERRVLPLLDEAVERHFEGTLNGSQAYLDDVLRRGGIEVAQEYGGNSQ